MGFFIFLMFTRLTFLEFLDSACGTVVPETRSKTGFPRSQLINKSGPVLPPKQVYSENQFQNQFA